MMNRLRKAKSPQTAFVEAGGDLCPWQVFLCANVATDPTKRNYKSLWKPIGGLPGVSSLRIGVFAPATESQKTIQYPSITVRLSSTHSIRNAPVDYFGIREN